MTISGLVQGVSFRGFIRHHALELGLKGWVRNTEDGRVEALFEGDRKAIEKILGLCRKGPPSSKVTGMRQEWEETDNNLENFEIIH